MEPAYGDEGYCPSCKEMSGSPKVAKPRKTGKRSADELSPHMDANQKRTRSDESTNALLTNVEELNVETLINRLKEAVQMVEETAKECELLRIELQQTKQEFTDYKTAFADNAFKAFMKQKKTK